MYGFNLDALWQNENPWGFIGNNNGNRLPRCQNTQAQKPGMFKIRTVEKNPVEKAKVLSLWECSASTF